MINDFDAFAAQLLVVHLPYATNAAKMAGTTPQRMPGNPAYATYRAMPNSDITERQAAEIGVSLRNAPFTPGKTKPNANRTWSTPRAIQIGFGKAFKAHLLASC